MPNILVIGFDTRNIACSAKRAGYTVCSIDAFMDQDLQECVHAFAPLGCRTPEELHRLEPARIKEKMETFGLEFDAVVLGSGLEMFDSSCFSCPVLASNPKAVQEASNKAKLEKKLADLELPHPACYSTEELEAIEYPVMLKPALGGGGVFNRVAENRRELIAILEKFSKLNPEFRKEDLVIQEFVKGISASVSVMATEEQARSIAVNEQLIGVSWLSNLPFAYCGNITPFKVGYEKEHEKGYKKGHEKTYEEIMETIAEELVLEFGLLGSNGVDFLATDKGPVVLEINPRFQGSLDTVEMATGMNLFEAHAGCFRGELPEKKSPKCFAARGVLYSDRELFIDQALMDIILRERSADVPCTGTIVEPEGPLTSLFACASTRKEALLGLERGVDRIKFFLNQTVKKLSLISGFGSEKR